MESLGSSTATSFNRWMMSVCSWLSRSQDLRGLRAKEVRNPQKRTSLWCKRYFGDHAIGGRPHFNSEASMLSVSCLSTRLRRSISSGVSFVCDLWNKLLIVSVIPSWWHRFPNSLKYFCRPRVSLLNRRREVTEVKGDCVEQLRSLLQSRSMNMHRWSEQNGPSSNRRKPARWRLSMTRGEQAM